MVGGRREREGAGGMGKGVGYRVPSYLKGFRFFQEARAFVRGRVMFLKT